MDSSLPPVIETYQHAQDRRDTPTALNTFSADATVIDEGVAYRGTERIERWLTDGASEYTFTRTLTGVEDLGEGVHVVSNHLSGDFPGGEVDLRYRFQLDGDRIQRLEIAP